jgi:hypothetical protein
MELTGDRPPGFLVIVIWTGLLGIASLLLSIPESLTHLPVGILYLVGAYGLWRQTRRGALLLVGAWVVGAVQAAVVRGSPLAILGAALVSGYLYSRRAALE